LRQNLETLRIMSFSFHPEAEAEFLKAIDYYEEREANLGLDFAIEVHHAIRRAIQHPKAWSILEGEIRRCQTRRFPYGILYSEEANEIFVLAVMHLHRDPDYWKHRLE
ncbi:MAG: type II toxin-antitoxin system RelE/ParE family toxin, partial [Syntrophaceae bacterium]|nr:type II toxin-antitoxin system RelE/ParE family toxin [Syntrophaceae bacterium]